MNAAILLGAILFWLGAWALNQWLVRQAPRSALGRRAVGIAVPVIFGVTLLGALGGSGARLSDPLVLLPPPLAIWARLIHSLPTLAADFRQTFLKAVLTGYALGCGAGFLAAIAIDRSPFLQRGLLPLGNFVSALPIIGIAPIMVMWFGFDWQSKAAVVVVMIFFPMLVNTVAGLAAATPMERDLMRSYAAGYWQTLVKLRLPAAAPFIFNALKINSTLALIGAIVAEFFGTPIVGMGFRISTEVGRHESRHGLGRDRRRGAGRLRLLRACRADRAGRHLLASVFPRWVDEVCGLTTEGDEMKKTIISMLAGALALAAFQALAADKVTLQLKWVTQAQFAGYYVAKDKGFYEEEGLDVKIKPGGPDIAPAQVHRRRRRRRDRRLDALGAGHAREGRAAGQHRPAVQALRHDADLPQGYRHHQARATSRARRSASGSSATSIRSCPGWASSASRPTAAPTASRC